jgi:hypothetical protein
MSGEIVRYWKYPNHLCKGCGGYLAIIGTRDNWPPGCLNKACPFYAFQIGHATPILQAGETPADWWPK